MVTHILRHFSRRFSVQGSQAREHMSYCRLFRDSNNLYKKVKHLNLIILNELITNVFKYAFESNANNQLIISLKNENELIQFKVKDNGIGLPPNLEIEELESLGLQLVVTLCDQLDATLSYKVDNGTEFLITFKKL